MYHVSLNCTVHYVVRVDHSLIQPGSVDRRRMPSPLILHQDKVYSACPDKLLLVDLMMNSENNPWLLEQAVSFMDIEKLAQYFLT